MNFFFDNNLPPRLARAVSVLSEGEPHVGSVIHLSDRFSRTEKDLVWIRNLADDGTPWYLISMDKFKKDHRAEREAIRRAGHTVYVLDPQWAHQQFWAKSAQFLIWWPLILQHARLTSGGVHRVPWKHTTQSKFQAL